MLLSSGARARSRDAGNRSAGAAQGCADPGDRAQERAERLHLAAAEAVEQLDLERVHRVDVRVSQPHGALNYRLPVEERLGLDDLEHRRDGLGVLLLERAEEP